MATRYEGCIALVLVAQLTHFCRLASLRGASIDLSTGWLRGLGSASDNLQVDTGVVLPTHSRHLLVIQMVIDKMSLLDFELLFVIHEHELTIGIDVVVLA